MRRDIPRRRFRGRELAAVAAEARRVLGDDAVVLGTARAAAGAHVEIVAATARDVARFEARVTPGPLIHTPSRPPRTTSGHPRGSGDPSATTVPSAAMDSRFRGNDDSGSEVRGDDGSDGRTALVIALVGPTGAGKTTTAIKLAVHADAFAGKKVGFVTLDTYRAGAVAQLESYARVAAIPMEVVYDAGDVAPAVERLADRDVIVVDTPGHGPSRSEWQALLDAIAPDETHLVIPATLRADVADAVRDAVPGATHALLTKLDEVPSGAGVSDLAARLDLPVRWVADGQHIPTDLAAGVPRLMDALAAGPESWA